jgi:predicted RNA-binding protein YlxR (DUF448 family)
MRRAAMMPTHSQNDTGVVNTHKVKPDEAPTRQCVVTREKLPPAAMMRFVLSPDGVVTPDITARLPGRGVWVTSTRTVLDEAIKTNAFARGLKTSATIPDGLADLVEQLLVKRCQGLLGFAKKAGAVVLGFEQVRAELRQRVPGWLFEASDGSSDGRDKVYSLAKALYETPRMACALSADELGMALGRERVIHGLLSKGPFAKKWTVDYARLTGFRKAPEEDWFSDRNR